MAIGQAILYTVLSVLGVSIIALIGIFFYAKQNLQPILLYLVSLSAGTLMGDAFLHLLPEVVEEHGFPFWVSVSVLGGIFLAFLVEKLIYWHHCHFETQTAHHVPQDHPASFAYMNLIGDGMHNFIDGLIIAGSYLVSIPVGVATTIAVALHEIPQEVGDFGVLVHGGFSKMQAILLNFLTALSALLGAGVAFVLAFWLEAHTNLFLPVIIAYAAGTFIYIAGSDLIPELHKQSRSLKYSLLQLLSFAGGIGLMMLLLLLE